MKSTSQGGIDAWPNEDYLNIWVCDLGGGLLGYATPPSNFLSNEDGVVINYKYFGNIGTAQAPYNKGRTATHEVGHWLNLDHIWGNGWGSCGNDNVSDTPVQEEENYSCPGFPHNPNSCGTSNQNGDMFMNYMDYTNDACMNLFTQGQKTRMISAINQYRSNLLNHNLCNSTPPTPSWNCINGSCVNPGNGTGSFTDYNNCLNNCFCSGNISTINETFQLSSIPNNWTIDNPDNSTTWEITNSAGYNSSSSIFINNADYSANGEYDDLTLPILDFSTASSINLDFNYAYTLWTNPNSTTGGAPWSDTLKILISDDCGQSWTNIWEKSGSNLATTTPVYNGFAWTPSNSSDWNYENINLNNYAFQDGITIKFRNINDFENNLFLDNINISTTNTDVDEILLDNKVIYPNPTEGIINININGIKTVYNILGEKILSSDSNILDLKDITEGIYFIHVKSVQYKIIKY